MKPAEGPQTSLSLLTLGKRKQWQITSKIMPRKLQGHVQAVARSEHQLEKKSVYTQCTCTAPIVTA